MEEPTDSPATAIAREKAVIERAYAATTNPEYLDDFETYWEAYMDMLLQQHSSTAVDLRNAPVNAHIARAITIIDQLGDFGTTRTHAQSLVDATPGPAVLLDRAGHVVAANEDAGGWLEALGHVGADLPLGAVLPLRLDPVAQDRLQDFLRQMLPAGAQDSGGGLDAPTSQDKRPASIIFLEGTMGEPVATDDATAQTPLCLMGTSVSLVAPEAVDPSAAERNTIYALLTSVDLEAGSMSEDPFAAAYELTPAETRIALDLAAGESARDIATRRGVAKTTLDKQIKIIRAKTGTRSIAHLVRKMSLMIAKARTVDTQLGRVSRAHGLNGALVRHRMITLRDGRRMSVMEQGHPRGRVVLNVHTVLGTGLLTRTGAQMAVLRGWRVITPWRAGFERSESVRYRDVDHMLDVTADDFRDVLDALQIDTAILIGARNGLSFCARHPKRARALLMINGLPIWHNDHLADFKGRRRNMLKTSIYAPAAVRYLVRVAQTLIRSGRADVFVRGLNKDSPTDLAALDDPEVFAVVEAGSRAMAAQGADAYAWDVRLRHTDLSALMARIKCPAALLYGGSISFMRETLVRDFAADWAEALIAVKRVPDVELYLQLTHPAQVFDMLDQLEAAVPA